MREKLAILDCGGQYTKVIDRKVRELGVYTDILPLGTPAGVLKDYQAIILSGGPSSVWAKGAPAYDSAIFELGLPTLGICYGMQLICEHFGGEVKPGVRTEYGQTDIDVDPACPLFIGLSARETVLMSHGDSVVRLPDGFEKVASTGEIIAGIYSPDRRMAGVQFHPEVDLTVNGIRVLENFLRGVCGLTETYALEDRIETSVKMIRDRVGDANVIVLVSGGVDSAVTAALLLRALPAEHVFAIHVDHGLMRKNESDVICENLKELGLIHLQRVNAEDEFFHGKIEVDGRLLGPLCETCDPEAKRQIIGSMFIRVTEEAANGFGLDFSQTFLAQGTLRPDLIESGNPDVSGYAHKIKTHHNDVTLIREARARGRIIETNWDWHKDEVRRVARMLGLDEEVASRQPFPGPGLGVRLICCESGIEPTAAETAALDALTHDSGIETAIAPVQSVGVQGDNRSYKHLVLLAGEPDFSRNFALAREIPNRLDFVNRCAVLLNREQLGGPLHCDGLHVCRESAELLREIDHIVTKHLMNPKISQCFAVLLPVSATPGKSYSAAIRAVCTSDFMTARPAMPGKDFPEEALTLAVRDITAAVGDKIDLVLYDVTGKPPATVEWE